jgi:hypothetical protein
VQMMSNDTGNLDYSWETIPFRVIGSNLRESSGSSTVFKEASEEC